MKSLFCILITAACFATPLFSQTVIGNVNSGAVSSNGLVYSVGEIFVKPVNADEASSGTLGIASQLLKIEVGVGELVFDNSVTLYPNPTAGQVSIVLEKPAEIQAITIFNAAGQTVLTQTLENGYLDVSRLPSGTYIMHTNNTTIKPIRFIKQ